MTMPLKIMATKSFISYHDPIPLRLLHFLIYENDIAAFGSAKIHAEIGSHVLSIFLS